MNGDSVNTVGWDAGVGFESQGVPLPLDGYIVVSEPRDAKDKGVVAKGGYEGKEFFSMIADHEGELGAVGNWS